MTEAAVQYVTAIAKDITEVPRAGKTPYWKVSTAETFTLDAQNPDGTPARPTYRKFVIWSSTAKDLIEGSLLGQSVEYGMKVSDQKLSYDPTAEEIKVGGNVVYPTAEEKAKNAAKRTGGGGGGGGRGGGYSRPDWTYQTIEERIGERRSIEAQTATNNATAVLVATLEPGSDPEAAMKILEDFVPRVAKAIRQAALQDVQQSGSGAPTAGKRAPRKRPDSSSSEPDSKPTAREARSEDPEEPEEPAAQMFEDPLMDQCVKLYGSVVEVQKAYRREFGKAPDLAAMTGGELATLIEVRDTPADMAAS